jgi:Glyoxalase/Bleomycin resistance protein/Dioxygenase superfamily
MSLFGNLPVFLMLAAVCCAEIPDYYKTVDRVTWIVRDIDHVKAGWVSLGLVDVHDYGKVKFMGQYHGASVTITARRLSGKLGDLIIDMVEPSPGQQNAFTDFLTRHGDGIFSVVHKVQSREEIANEIRRMHGLDVDVLQEISVGKGSHTVTYTYFNTEPKGKYTLGLVYSESKPDTQGKRLISHIAPVVRESDSVSAFWQSLGFPAFAMEHANPREDSRYRHEPLWFAFEVGFQHFDQMSYEWIVPPSTPPNIYADFLNLHGEGIQHLGMPVDDLEKAAAVYEKLGYSVWQSGAWGDLGKKNSGQYKYMDTDSIGGVSVELIHAY